MWVDHRTWTVRLHYAKGDKPAAIQELLEMVKYNYTKVKEEFQSIYNLHELLICLAIPLCLENGVKVDFEMVSKLDQGEVQENKLFSKFEPTQEWL